MIGSSLIISKAIKTPTNNILVFKYGKWILEKVLNFEYPKRYAFSSIELFIFEYPDLIPLYDSEKNLTKYAITRPIIDPINTFLKPLNPKMELKKSLNHEINVIKATAKIIPGKA